MLKKQYIMQSSKGSPFKKQLKDIELDIDVLQGNLTKKSSLPPSVRRNTNAMSRQIALKNKKGGRVPSLEELAMSKVLRTPQIRADTKQEKQMLKRLNQDKKKKENIAAAKKTMAARMSTKR